MKTAIQIKSHGIHYTPPELSAFLAKSIASKLDTDQEVIQILDPACGDGGLLMALAEALPENVRHRIILVGYDKDADALDEARDVLSHLAVKDIQLKQGDFLENFDGFQKPTFDAVISNPPYVRTQVLGSLKAQELAVSFGLTGRVDLYQAFTVAMTAALKDGGVLGLLTSNRFLSTLSGAQLRNHLRTEYQLTGIYDLGDTKLFTAAVLPVIVIGRKDPKKQDSESIFCRIYEHRSKDSSEEYPKFSSVLEALTGDIEGIVRTPKGLFLIERGNLAPAENITDPWSLVSEESKKWLEVIAANQECTFDDVVKIKVGIKTTADNVFISSKWNELPFNVRPEQELLHSLIRSSDGDKWNMGNQECGDKVLYLYESLDDKRVPIDLTKYPKCRNFLESHEAQLKGRKYVMDSGREWYAIWVPHKPSDWIKPKVVFPDISEDPKFFLDVNGYIVNGDCYWITPKEDMHTDLLYLILAVANSSFIVSYYDTVFHNKLYAGRRRFMAQYVKKFPLPKIKSALSEEIIGLVKSLITAKPSVSEASLIESKIDDLVWKSFGLKKVAR